MTFQQIQYVYEVAVLGSINKAARTLFVSQPSISNAILHLEKELEIKIFERSATGVTLTDDGKEFLGYARALIRQKDQVEEVFKSRAIARGKKLVVASQHIAPTALAMLKSLGGMKDSSYHVHIRELQVNQILHEVSTANCEVGVLFFSDILKRYFDNNLKNYMDFHELSCPDPCVCVHRDHPLAKMECVTEDDLHPYPYVCMERETVPSFDHAEDVRLNFTHQAQQIIYTTDRATIDDILIGSNAYHISCGMDAGHNKEYLRLVPLKNYPMRMRFGWVALKNHKLSPEAREFIAHLTQVTDNWIAVEASTAR